MTTNGDRRSNGIATPLIRIALVATFALAAVGGLAVRPANVEARASAAIGEEPPVEIGEEIPTLFGTKIGTTSSGDTQGLDARIRD
jgi:hypothetical protein